jgi:RHS repeat-associated protein
VVTTYAFDKQHRPTGTSYNDGSTPSVTLSYDQSSVSGVALANYLGNLTNAVAANGTASTIFSYDKMNRVAENWQCTPLNCGSSTFSLTYNYDYLGDVTSLANSKEGATYTYSYDTLARLTKLQSTLSDSNHPGTLVTVNTYNPLGEVTKATLGNAIVRITGYDNRGRMTSLTDGSIYNFTLVFAPDSDILTGNDSINGNWSYTYDDFNRISGSNKNSGAQTFSYVYDRYSNRWQQNAPQGGPAPQYNFNSNNQITTSGVLYDAAGNVTNDGLGNSYTYDAENRVISMTGNNSASYVYDALGHRVRETISSVPYDFIYNGGRAVDEVTASGWVWGDAGATHVAVYSNSTTYFTHNDWLGTVRAWSNVSGSSVATCTSMPFGDAQTCTGTSPNSWNYTGLPFDFENGLSHGMFRQLSTTQGRWISPDPAGLSAVNPTNPQSWNRYAYVANSPLSYIDPSGLIAVGCSGELHASADPWCSGGGSGGGAGGGGGFCNGSSDCNGTGGIFCDASGGCGSGNAGLLSGQVGNFQQSMGVYLSCLSYYFQCDANGNYYNPNYLNQANGQYKRLSVNAANDFTSPYTLDPTTCNLSGGHCNFAFTCSDWGDCGLGRHDDGLHVECAGGGYNCSPNPTNPALTSLWIHDDTVSPWVGDFTLWAIFTGNFWEHGFVDLIGGTFFVGAFPQ